jgi:hypothetical protein
MQMVVSRIARPLAWLAPLTLVAVRLWLGPYTADDAYITFRYSENLASGAGFTYNPPERVLGTTAPLIALLLVIPAHLQLDPGWTMLLVSIAGDMMTLLCGVTLLQRAGWRVAAILYAIAVAMWPGLLIYSVSGLETSLYVGLCALACLRVDEARPKAAGVALGLAILCRPDGLLLAAALVAVSWRRDREQAWRLIAALVIVVTPWIIFSSIYFSSPIPSSVTSKVESRVTVPDSLNAFRLRLFSGPYLALAPFVAIGAAALVGARAIFPWIGMWWVAYALVFILTGAFGPYPWYYVPLLPPYFAALGAGVERVIRPAPPHARRYVSAIAATLTALALGARLVPLARTLETWHQEREALYRRVAQTYLKDSACTVAATEIGALGYFYQGRILDLVGLVTPRVTQGPLIESIRAEEPCWLITYSDLIGAALIQNPDFTRTYALVARERVSERRELLLFRRR